MVIVRRFCCSAIVWKNLEFLALLLVPILCILKIPAYAESRTILFVDDQDVLYRSGTERTLHHPTRHPKNPIISESRPWEVAIGYCSVYRNPKSGKHQAWYQAYSGGRAKDPSRRVVVCYAESPNGIAWHKPKLNLFAYNETDETNIVLVGNGGRSVNYGAAVIVDHRDRNPTKLYKMAYWDFVKNDGKDIPGLCVAFSPDGIHWTKHNRGPLLSAAYGEPGQPPFEDADATEPDLRPAISDVIDLMFDPLRNSFVIYAKTWIDGPDGQRFWKRAVVRTESKDFIQWSTPQLVMAPSDSEFGQLHGAPVFIRHGVYFGLVQQLDFGGFDRAGTGNMPAELAISRDGIQWLRPFQGNSFIPVPGDGKSFDAGCLWTNAMPVCLDDEIRFYYGAYPGWNADIENERTGIGFATLPRDRFVSLKPTDTHGQITLKPVWLDGSEIQINANATEGKVWVEILSSGGYRLPGFSKDVCLPVQTDTLNSKLRWKTKQLADLPKKKYQIRIHLEKAHIFALSIK